MGWFDNPPNPAVVASSASGRRPKHGRLWSSIAIPSITQGVVAGIPGYLLSEGDRLGLDIVALLAECNPMYPDARAAAVAVEAVSDLVGIEIPLHESLEDAVRIEAGVREMMESSTPLIEAPEDLGGHDPMVG